MPSIFYKQGQEAALALLFGTKVAAFPNIMKAMNGAKPIGSFPTGATQLLKTPQPPKLSGGQLTTPKIPGMNQQGAQGVVDPRASKPPGMNLQHQVQDTAHTFDVGNSMSSPQRRFASPL